MAGQPCVHMELPLTAPMPSIVGDRRTRRYYDQLLIYCVDQADAEKVHAALPGSTITEVLQLDMTRRPGEY